MGKWAYVMRSSDRASFKRCRRAWDLGSEERQNYERIKPMRLFDFERAIHDALAVYYFPGMWEWNREIVLPLALEGFSKSMRKQKGRYVKKQEITARQEEDWNEHLQLGEKILENYFKWAPTVDHFSPIQVETEFDANIADPNDKDRDLTVPGEVSGHMMPVHYRGRIDLLILDENNSYWLVDHRIIKENWEELDQLVLDERGISHCWGLENFHLGMKIAGTIYNELRKKVPEISEDNHESYRESSTGDQTSTSSVGKPKRTRPPMQADEHGNQIIQRRRLYMQSSGEADPNIKQEGNNFFRRTQIPRNRALFENFANQIALEALDITDPKIRLYPTPSPENCSNCPYRKPCIAMNEDSDAESILQEFYRKRMGEQDEKGRIGGSTWSMDRGAIPPNFRNEDG